MRILKFRQEVEGMIPGHTTSELNATEISKAEKIWLKFVQKTDLPEGIDDLDQNKSLSKSSRIFNPSSYLNQDGILNMKGRIGTSRNSEELTENSIILDSKNYYTRLVIHYDQTSKSVDK
ncbi:hypothetical protein JTB14_013282 [Gonioctena quinquepunctata]|nr:hypothetical protein JTB14_013282 [Gonioctena quinquepunctata]